MQLFLQDLWPALIKADFGHLIATVVPQAAPLDEETSVGVI